MGNERVHEVNVERLPFRVDAVTTPFESVQQQRTRFGSRPAGTLRAPDANAALSTTSRTCLAWSLELTPIWLPQVCSPKPTRRQFRPVTLPRLGGDPLGAETGMA